MPSRKPGRVTRSCISCGSWQSTQPTGCAPSTCSNSISVAAGDRIRRTGLDHLRVRGGVRHRPEHREALEHVARAEPAVGRDHGRVAVQAVAGLRTLGHALRLLLVGEHVGVAAPVAVVDRERVAGEQALEPRIAFDPPSRARPEPPYCVCGRVRRCAGNRRTGAPSSCPTAPNRSSSSLTAPAGGRDSSPPACAGRCSSAARRRRRRRPPRRQRHATRQRGGASRARFSLMASPSAAGAVADAAMAMDAPSGAAARVPATSARARNRRDSAGSSPEGSPRCAA